MAARTLEELVDEAAARLTAEQLRAIAARVEVEARSAIGEESPRPDLAAEIAFAGLRTTVRRRLNAHRERGIDDDLAASQLLPALLRSGVDKREAVAALKYETGWQPRTDTERAAVVAKSMLDDDWPADVVRLAVAAAYGLDEAA